MRYLIDTHIFIWYAKEKENLSHNVLAIIDDFENNICVSSESLKELVQLWHSKPHIRRWWSSPLDIIRSIEVENGFRILYLHKEHYETYARMVFNEAMNHHDPSDHLIIAHAITNGIPLISSDQKFPFYKNQGLDLIPNER